MNAYNFGWLSDLQSTRSRCEPRVETRARQRRCAGRTRSGGFHRRPTSRALRVRAELLEQGGPALWQELMDQLRRPHLGSGSPARSPSVRERLNAACLAAANSCRPCPRAPTDAGMTHARGRRSIASPPEKAGSVWDNPEHQPERTRGSLLTVRSRPAPPRRVASASGSGGTVGYRHSSANAGSTRSPSTQA
jgi:hypothetical protein